MDFAAFKAYFYVVREWWFDLLIAPLGLVPHLAFFVILGWLIRRARGQSYAGGDVAIDATRGLSITMYIALFAGLADLKGIEILLASGVGRSQICLALFLGLLQELEGFFRRTYGHAVETPQRTPGVAGAAAAP